MAELVLVATVAELALVGAVVELAALVSAMAEVVPDVLHDDR